MSSTMDLANKRQTVTLFLVWVTLLGVAWFASPALVRSVLRLSAALPHRAVVVELSREEREKTKDEIDALKEKIFTKKQHGDTGVTQDILELAIRYEKLGAYWMAQAHLAGIIRRDGTNAQAWTHLSRVLEGLTLYSDAAESWRTTIELDPKNPSHYARLAYVFDRRFNDSFGANGIYVEGLVRSGNTPELMRSYALFLERIGEKNTALLYWKALLEKEPGDTSIQDRISDLEKD